MGDDIGWAVKKLKAGLRVTRPGLQPYGVWLVLDGVQMQILAANGESALPWQPTHADLLADDWTIFEDFLAGSAP